MSTSFDGLGAVLPPPKTHIKPLKLTARVSPVALGILVIVMMESATGSYLNESAYRQATRSEHRFHRRYR
jgi:hypothetical protein